MVFPTGVAGRDREACTAVSILSMSSVGELGADMRVLSVVLSRTANSCLRSAGKQGRHTATLNNVSVVQQYICVVQLVKQSAHNLMSSTK